MPNKKPNDPVPVPGAGPMVPGKYLILATFALALAAAMASWVFYARLQRRPLELWGTRAGVLILRSPTARAFRLVPAAEAPSKGADPEAGDRLTINGREYVAHEPRDITTARGFSHVRQGLIHDRTFAWDAEPADDPRWEYAIEFADGDETAVLAFNFHSQRAALAGDGPGASIKPVVGAFEAFLHEQFEEAAEAAKPDGIPPEGTPK